MASSLPPARRSPRDWPSLTKPPGVQTRPLLRAILAGQGLDVITDALSEGTYWAIVKEAAPAALPTALLCLTSRGRTARTLHYLIVTERDIFPEIPPRSFYARILANCPAPPSKAAADRRALFVKRYADLDAMPDYPVGTEFTLLGKRLRIITPLGPRSCSAIDIADGGQYLIKREHLLSATIHLPDEHKPSERPLTDDQT